MRSTKQQALVMAFVMSSLSVAQVPEWVSGSQFVERANALMPSYNDCKRVLCDVLHRAYNGSKVTGTILCESFLKSLDPAYEHGSRAFEDLKTGRYPSVVGEIFSMGLSMVVTFGCNVAYETLSAIYSAVNQ